MAAKASYNPESQAAVCTFFHTGTHAIQPFFYDEAKESDRRRPQSPSAFVRRVDTETFSLNNERLRQANYPANNIRTNNIRTKISDPAGFSLPGLLQ